MRRSRRGRGWARCQPEAASSPSITTRWLGHARPQRIEIAGARARTDDDRDQGSRNPSSDIVAPTTTNQPAISTKRASSGTLEPAVAVLGRRGGGGRPAAGVRPRAHSARRPGLAVDASSSPARRRSVGARRPAALIERPMTKGGRQVRRPTGAGSGGRTCGRPRPSRAARRAPTARAPARGPLARPRLRDVGLRSAQGRRGGIGVGGGTGSTRRGSGLGLGRRRARSLGASRGGRRVEQSPASVRSGRARSGLVGDGQRRCRRRVVASARRRAGTMRRSVQSASATVAGLSARGGAARATAHRRRRAGAGAAVGERRREPGASSAGSRARHQVGASCRRRTRPGAEAPPRAVGRDRLGPLRLCSVSTRRLERPAAPGDRGQQGAACRARQTAVGTGPPQSTHSMVLVIMRAPRHRDRPEADRSTGSQTSDRAANHPVGGHSTPRTSPRAATSAMVHTAARQAQAIPTRIRPAIHKTRTRRQEEDTGAARAIEKDRIDRGPAALARGGRGDEERDEDQGSAARSARATTSGCVEAVPSPARASAAPTPSPPSAIRRAATAPTISPAIQVRTTATLDLGRVAQDPKGDRGLHVQRAVELAIGHKHDPHHAQAQGDHERQSASGRAARIRAATRRAMSPSAAVYSYLAAD